MLSLDLEDAASVGELRGGSKMLSFSIAFPEELAASPQTTVCFKCFVPRSPVRIRFSMSDKGLVGSTFDNIGRRFQLSSSTSCFTATNISSSRRSGAFVIHAGAVALATDPLNGSDELLSRPSHLRIELWLSVADMADLARRDARPILPLSTSSTEFMIAASCGPLLAGPELEV